MLRISVFEIISHPDVNARQNIRQNERLKMDPIRKKVFINLILYYRPQKSVTVIKVQKKFEKN